MSAILKTLYKLAYKNFISIDEIETKITKENLQNISVVKSNETTSCWQSNRALIESFVNTFILPLKASSQRQQFIFDGSILPCQQIVVDAFYLQEKLVLTIFGFSNSTVFISFLKNIREFLPEHYQLSIVQIDEKYPSTIPHEALKLCRKLQKIDLVFLREQLDANTIPATTRESIVSQKFLNLKYNIPYNDKKLDASELEEYGFIFEDHAHLEFFNPELFSDIGQNTAIAKTLKKLKKKMIAVPTTPTVADSGQVGVPQEVTSLSNQNILIAHENCEQSESDNTAENTSEANSEQRSIPTSENIIIPCEEPVKATETQPDEKDEDTEDDPFIMEAMKKFDAINSETKNDKIKIAPALQSKMKLMFSSNFNKQTPQNNSVTADTSHSTSKKKLKKARSASESESLFPEPQKLTTSNSL